MKNSGFPSYELWQRKFSQYYGCKQFNTAPEPAPPQGDLPKERTEQMTSFNVVGINYAGPIYYRSKTKEKNLYMIIYTCSLTQWLHLELLPDMSYKEFLASFKRFVAVRGRPEKIISDNGKTFHAASKWIKKAARDEKFHAFLQDYQIRWQFNLSKASWWGGMFERMAGLVKNSLYNVVGSAKLTFKELQDVLLDIQIALNNQPLTYCEGDVQLPVLIYLSRHTRNDFVVVCMAKMETVKNKREFLCLKLFLARLKQKIIIRLP